MHEDANLVDMIEYLDTWRKSLEEMRATRPKTQFMDFTFEQSDQGTREVMNVMY